MTEQQFLEEIKQLSVATRISLIEAISRSLLEELEMSGRDVSIFGKEHPETNTQNERELKIDAAQRLHGILKTSKNLTSEQKVGESRVVDNQDANEGKTLISQRLYGILKFDGAPPTDEEVKDAYADYLLEKYS
jgi:hypothetical protein